MKRQTLPIILASTLAVGFLISKLVGTSRAATETPDYKVVRSDGKFEIRDYPALSLATTSMEGVGMNGGFGRLFRFITGSNVSSEKIQMTTPVLINTASNQRTMSFIMPGKVVEKGLPRPSEENVRFGRVEAARFAVLRFRGGRTDGNEKEAVGKLTAWLAAQKIAGKGDPIFAYYDPPWTPLFMRRNEVMILVEEIPDLGREDLQNRPD